MKENEYKSRIISQEFRLNIQMKEEITSLWKQSKMD